MSMNLVADKIELWQTPTWVTYMCLYTENAEGVRREDEWPAVRYRYARWVESRMNGVWDDVTAHEEMRRRVREHLAELYAVGELKFSII